MKIAKITLNEYKPFIKNKNTNNTTRQQENTVATIPVLNAYRDYSINFRGRTPENFYEQEFNIKYMPLTMKEFLNSEYEERKHIPPEQLMSESFKYLAITDNFADVKSTYPNETLFDNLHEASLKGRSGVLSDIKLAKEMSDTPLINDGTDDLGIYLLRKIYLEGKTIKEINKDFYEKDLNPEYKGIITQPITYGTTSAYGIQYPKTDFWNSFIATRDEYKKFFVNMPKQNKADLKKELIQIHNNHKTEENKPIHRKYKIKHYQKEQIKKDIVKTKGDEEALKKTITKRFAKEDPEASFFVKYLSPIMTIAADRIHLSEELKDFAENIKSKEDKIENLLSKFWKTHPELLEYYSTAITDTIDLFEETYENGGLLPINNEYKVITPNTSNQKAIDFVPQRFVELLNYVQTISPQRELKYIEHENEQKKWDEHFLWRYGNENSSSTQKESNTSIEEMIEKSAKENNAKIYVLNGAKGNKIHITCNLDETVGEYFKKEFIGFPSNFINLITRKALQNPLMTENAKLSFSTISIADKINDSRILEKTEQKKIINSITSEMNKELSYASIATLDTLAARAKFPHKIYRTMLPNHAQDDIDEYSKGLLFYSGNPDFEKELNSLYDFYKIPLTNSEVNKITNMVLDYIRNFDLLFSHTEKSVLFRENNFIQEIENLRIQCSKYKILRQMIKKEISKNITASHIGKSLLIKNDIKEVVKSKIEMIASILLTSVLRTMNNSKKL